MPVVTTAEKVMVPSCPRGASTARRIRTRVIVVPCTGGHRCTADEHDLPRRPRAPPQGAPRVLLPDARLGVRGGRRRAGDPGAGVEGERLLRGTLRRTVLALP